MELKHAILGLLSIQPMSGYDLGRAFASSVAHFWHADQSQIYRTLDRLAEAGAIDTEVIAQQDKPDRKVHSLTALGYEQLDTWLASPIEVAKTKDPLLARLFFVDRLGRQEALRILDDYEALVREQQAQLQRIPAIDQSDVAGVLRSATLRYGITGAEMELVWLQETRDRLEAL
ncbi:MAG: PadR family transcriptional regulator [Gulosibacter sp.]|uniref:PadR family transcriptional regulator n=1 Tax=Gulosibacter sp. TaxID=2817531 RepID=UPI003F92080A